MKYLLLSTMLTACVIRPNGITATHMFHPTKLGLCLSTQFAYPEPQGRDIPTRVCPDFEGRLGPLSGVFKRCPTFSDQFGNQYQWVIYEQTNLNSSEPKPMNMPLADYFCSKLKGITKPES